MTVNETQSNKKKIAYPNIITPPIFLKIMMITHHLPAKYLGRILPLSGPTEYFDYRFISDTASFCRITLQFQQKLIPLQWGSKTWPGRGIKFKYKVPSSAPAKAIPSRILGRPYEQSLYCGCFVFMKLLWQWCNTAPLSHQFLSVRPSDGQVLLFSQTIPRSHFAPFRPEVCPKTFNLEEKW